MTRYFFHIVDDGRTVMDEEGDEFSNLEEARASAIRAVRELVAAQVKGGQTIRDSRLEVRDAAGDLQLSLSFHQTVDELLGR